MIAQRAQSEHNPNRPDCIVELGKVRRERDMMRQCNSYLRRKYEFKGRRERKS